MKKIVFLTGISISLLIISCEKKQPISPVTKTTNQPEGKKEQPMTGSLTLSKTEVSPREEISVDFNVEGAIGKNAWVGIIPSDVEHGDENVNDQYDVDYQYLGNRTSGTLVFAAPVDNGSYDFRLNSTDNNGVEVASASFTVEGEMNTKADLKLEKNTFAKGEQITLNFMANPSWEKKAWIGLVPAGTKHGSATENDQYDVAYDYLNKRSKGTMKFSAPSEAGKYSFRMFDAYTGKEVKSIDFIVR